MSREDYTISFTVDQSPEEVYRAINNVRGWWDGKIEGSTDKVGDVFTYSYGNFHRSKQEVTELVPGKRVSWQVLEGGPKFVNNKTEWKGTKIIFGISSKGNRTEVRFTHMGLIPRLDCYDSCSDAWGTIISSDLRKLIGTGKGQSTQ